MAGFRMRMVQRRGPQKRGPKKKDDAAGHMTSWKKGEWSSGGRLSRGIDRLLSLRSRSWR